MADKAMDNYLNDHLAGAMFGSDLAEQIGDMNEDTPLGSLMHSLAADVEEDRQALIDLMARMGTTQNQVKQATTWIAEKASRVKFSGLSSGESEFGTFMALESMKLGVLGKLSLWRVLRQHTAGYEALDAAELDRLIQRAETQAATLEDEQFAAATRAFEGSAATPTEGA